MSRLRASIRRSALRLAALALAAVLVAPIAARAEHEEGHPAAAHEGAHEKSGDHAAGAHGAAGEHAGGHETPHIDVKSLGLQLLNFAILVALIIKFGGPAINKALQARHTQLKAELASAAEARAAAETRLAQQEKRLAALEHEIAAIQAGIKQEAEVEKARLIGLSEDRAKRIQEETAFLLDQQVKEAEDKLRREAAQAAVDMAERIIRATVDARDQQRLIENFVTDAATTSTRSPA